MMGWWDGFVEWGFRMTVSFPIMSSLIVASSSIRATMTSPLLAVFCCLINTKSPSFIPFSFMESPLAFRRKYRSGGRTNSASTGMRASMFSSAKIGRPHDTAPIRGILMVCFPVLSGVLSSFMRPSSFLLK